MQKISVNIFWVKRKMPDLFNPVIKCEECPLGFFCQRSGRNGQTISLEFGFRAENSTSNIVNNYYERIRFRIRNVNFDFLCLASLIQNITK